MKLFALIRHAVTRWNVEKKIQGRGDLPLSPQGIIQAEIWAHRLKPISFDMIISSPMHRACQTARIIALKLKLDVELVDDLREQDFGDWEGKTIQELRTRFPGSLESEERRGWDFRPPKGESRRDVLKRVVPALREKAQKKGHQCLVVTHNSVMKCLIYSALALPFVPGNKKMLKPYHLHWLGMDDGANGRSKRLLRMVQVNALDLERSSTHQPASRNK